MTSKVVLFMAIAVLLLFDGCAPTLYQQWGAALKSAPEHNATLDDISLLLGSAPTRCDPVSDVSPMLGIRTKDLTVTGLWPNSPAEKAGVRKGDTIKSIAGNVLPDDRGAISAFRDNAKVDTPLLIETNRGASQVIPRMPKKVEQCYWEIRAGSVARSSSGAFVNPYGGGASSGSAAYQRFCRASCRITEGFVNGCSWNWQQ